MSQAETTTGHRERPGSRGGRLVRIENAAKSNDPGISRIACGETECVLPAFVLDGSRCDRLAQRKHF